MFKERYLIYISIAYYLTLSIAIDFLGRKKWIFYALASLSILLMVATCKPDTGNKRKKKEMVETVKSLMNEHTIVYLCPEWIKMGFVYHYNIDYFNKYEHTWDMLRQDNIFPIRTVDQVNEKQLLQHNKVVYLDGWSELVDKDGLIFKKINQHYKLMDSNTKFEGFKIYTFIRK